MPYVFSLKAMSLIESRQIAKDHSERSRFVVTLTDGPHNAQWIDPWLGVFIVPDVADGAFYECDHPHVVVSNHP